MWPLLVIGGGLAALAYANNRQTQVRAPVITPRERYLAERLQVLSRHAQDLLGVSAAHRVPLAVYQQGRGVAWAQGRQIFVGLDQLMPHLSAYHHGSECETAMLLGLVAHELGHALDPYERSYTNRPAWNHRMELDADHLAGFVLARAGVSPQCFGSMIFNLSDCCTGSVTHPAGFARVHAIREGFALGS